jgi:hypothetical protein
MTKTQSTALISFGVYMTILTIVIIFVTSGMKGFTRTYVKEQIHIYDSTITIKNNAQKDTIIFHLKRIEESVRHE